MSKSNNGNRAAIYARFSSDNQNERSIDDQIALCRNLAKRQNLRVVATFEDRAKSATTIAGRNGLDALMKAAENGKFEVLVIENTHRFVRDIADSAALRKRLKFFKIKTLTTDGYLTPEVAAFKAVMDEYQIKTIGDTMRRCLDGRVREGKFPGAVTYGYRRVEVGTAPDGTVMYAPGEREINQAEAEIVRRIFTEYASGKSPRAIAADLNRDGVPTRSGKGEWSHQAFIGSKLRHGMLGNRLYIGEIEWNQTYSVKHPDRGTDLKRAAAPEVKVTSQVPRLRIIDQQLWNAAHAVCEQRSGSRHGGNRRPNGGHPRSDYLLAGLLRCAVCGGPMRISQTPPKHSVRVACSAAIMHGTCQHTKSYGIDQLQACVISNLDQHLSDPEMMLEMIRTYHVRYAQRMKAEQSDAADLERRRDRLQVQIERYEMAIGESDEDVHRLMAKRRALIAERNGILQRLEHERVQANVVRLHPNSADGYRRNFERLRTALVAPKSVECRTALRNLIDSVAVHPTGRRKPYEISVYARQSVLLGVDLFPSQSAEEAVSASESRKNACTPTANQACRARCI